MTADIYRAPGLARVRGPIALALVIIVVATVALQIPAGRALSAGEGTIAFVSDRDGDPEIFTVAPDGSGLQQITANSAWDTEPAWSPDSTKLAFSSNRDGDDDIYIKTLSGPGVTNLTNAGSGRDVQPDWSPDGKTIAFVRDSDVYLVSSSGASAPVKLGPGLSPSWSPDGTKIAFVRDGDVHVMNPNGSGSAPLTVGLMADLPDWSPDGSKIAVESTAGEGGESRIAVMDSDGSDVVVLPGEGEDFAPSWSPDGQSLVLTNLTMDADVVVMGLEGDRRTLVTGTAYDFLPAWSPCPPGTCPAPTPSDSGSPTASPTGSPSVSPTGPVEEPKATSLSLAHQVTRRRIKAAGSLSHPHPGLPIRVLLSKRKAGRWAKVALRQPQMDSHGNFAAGFRNPRRAKRCRLKVRFTGDADHLPSRKVRRFRC